MNAILSKGKYKNARTIQIENVKNINQFYIFSEAINKNFISSYYFYKASFN